MNTDTINTTNDKVIEFIQRRFTVDCDWTSGNCYYFAVILKARFPKGKIYYDVIDGHFLFGYKGRLYNYDGIQSTENRLLIRWCDFDNYDKNQKKVVRRDCIK